ncbi:hypothetical protein AU467_30140 [Mesorhizobium loti]|uniref:Uncharacterized protein n=1 Tax=Rhizobium loti TaxID=381 RepID=A0A101KP80_RHILI|nr:hypothetical protein AU467_30140 [Mesorhizobium loti]
MRADVAGIEVWHVYTGDMAIACQRKVLGNFGFCNLGKRGIRERCNERDDAIRYSRWRHRISAARGCLKERRVIATGQGGADGQD